VTASQRRRERSAVEVRSAILDLLARRDPSSSICPSDAARRCDAEDWRDLMDAVRQEAAELARAGVIEVTQGDDAVSISEARGPVRLRRGPRWGGA